MPISTFSTKIKKNPGGEQSAFGSLLPGRSYSSNTYKYGFNGMENDNEFSSNTGTHLDFGARIYDSRLGRWLSVDPRTNEDPDMSPYCGLGNNPIMFVDPDGEKIVVPKVEDRVPILKLINAKSANVYGFNAKGELYLVKRVEKPEVGHSKYYSERLEKAINDVEVITVQIGQTYQQNGVTKNVDKDAGGGVTVTSKNANPLIISLDVTITISGNENKNLKDMNGNPLRDDAGDILLHEFVGHAIPHISGSDTGNAVANENKARKDADPNGYLLRKAEPQHDEGVIKNEEE